MKPIIVNACGPSDNWGDALNKPLVEKLSGRQVEMNYTKHRNPMYLVCGSILARACEQHIVWGTGFIAGWERARAAPKEIRLVRGPLSRKSLKISNIECPEMYGDPALLAPQLWPRPDPEKRWDLGIMPHYIEKKHPALEAVRTWRSTKIIDIEAGIEEVIDEVVACRAIGSSSLHGIICADAYGVPALRVHVNGMRRRSPFKFNDYGESVGYPQREIPSLTSRDKIIQLAHERAARIRIEACQQMLRETCPWSPCDG